MDNEEKTKTQFLTLPESPHRKTRTRTPSPKKTTSSPTSPRSKDATCNSPTSPHSHSKDINHTSKDQNNNSVNTADQLINQGSKDNQKEIGVSQKEHGRSHSRDVKDQREIGVGYKEYSRSHSRDVNDQREIGVSQKEKRRSRSKETNQSSKDYRDGVGSPASPRSNNPTTPRSKDVNNPGSPRSEIPTIRNPEPPTPETDRKKSTSPLSIYHKKSPPSPRKHQLKSPRKEDIDKNQIGSSSSDKEADLLGSPPKIKKQTRKNSKKPRDSYEEDENLESLETSEIDQYLHLSDKIRHLDQPTNLPKYALKVSLANLTKFLHTQSSSHIHIIGDQKRLQKETIMDLLAMFLSDQRISTILLGHSERILFGVDLIIIYDRLPLLISVKRTISKSKSVNHMISGKEIEKLNRTAAELYHHGLDCDCIFLIVCGRSYQVEFKYIRMTHFVLNEKITLTACHNFTDYVDKLKINTPNI